MTKNHEEDARSGHRRFGWDEAFAAMAARGDDRLLDLSDLSPTKWEETEWAWE